MKLSLRSKADADAPPSPSPSPAPAKKERPPLMPWIITALAVVGVFYALGARVWFVGALAIGAVMWYICVKKITKSDGKIILIVNIDNGEISPYIVGRARWRETTKIGRPMGNFATASGNYVDVLKSYDPETNTAEYPAGNEYSDLYIASIPEKYNDLIKTLTETKKEIIGLKQLGEINALEMAKKHIGEFASEINRVITPRKGNETPEDGAKSGHSGQKGEGGDV